MLLLNINEKPHMGNPMTLSYLTLGDFESSRLRSLTFQNIIFSKGADVGLMLLLNTNRKLYMGSPMTLSYLTWRNLERSSKGHSDFEVLYLAKEHCPAIYFY